MTKKIKIHDPFFDNKEKNAILKVLDSHNWAMSKGNGLVSKFEEQFKNFVGAKDCVAVDSCSMALLISMSMLDIKNKEVIIPSLSHVSLAHSIILNGGKPVLVDIDPKTLCLDPVLVKKAISNKTKIIAPVHFGGIPCDLTSLKKLAHDYNLQLVEDAALATGSKYNKKYVGSHSDFVCFSFHPVKIMSSPKGGIIALNGKHSKRIKQKISFLRNSGYNSITESVKNLGYNAYMNEFSASICLEQLKKLKTITKKRLEVVTRYSNEINSLEKMPLNKECSYSFYWIKIKNQKSFFNKMNDNNIEIVNYHPPIHTLEYYKTEKKLENTENAYKHLALLPVHPNLTNNDIDKIIHLANKFS